MKITKWVDVGQEVEIEISVVDVRDALAEAFDNITQDRLGEEGPTPEEIKATLNNIGQFLNALTDEQIILLGHASCKIVGAFLASQSKRFWNGGGVTP